MRRPRLNAIGRFGSAEKLKKIRLSYFICAPIPYKCYGIHSGAAALPAHTVLGKIE